MIDIIRIIFFQSLVSFCTVFVAFYLLHEFTTARQMLGAKKYIQDKTYQFKQGLNDKYQVKYICLLTVPSSRQELYGPDNISPFSKCRTVGRHAGDHHGSPFPNRVLCASTSKHIYRQRELIFYAFVLFYMAPPRLNVHF